MKNLGRNLKNLLVKLWNFHEYLKCQSFGYYVLSDCIFFLFIVAVIYFIGYVTLCVLNYDDPNNSIDFLITLRFVFGVVTIGVVTATYVVISSIKFVWDCWKTFNKLEVKEKLREN